MVVAEKELGRKLSELGQTVDRKILLVRGRIRKNSFLRLTDHREVVGLSLVGTIRTHT